MITKIIIYHIGGQRYFVVNLAYNKLIPENYFYTGD